MAEQVSGVATGSGLTEAREQEIRAWVADADEGWRLRYVYAEELLAEIDRLRADQERLREVGNALAEAVEEMHGDAEPEPETCEWCEEVAAWRGAAGS